MINKFPRAIVKIVAQAPLLQFVFQLIRPATRVSPNPSNWLYNRHSRYNPSLLCQRVYEVLLRCLLCQEPANVWFEIFPILFRETRHHGTARLGAFGYGDFAYSGEVLPLGLDQGQADYISVSTE